MPNWAEGTLKVRGTKENIINFMKNGISFPPRAVLSGKEIIHKTNELQIKQDDQETNLFCEYGFYINDTRRAFVENKNINFYHEDDADIFNLEITDFRQAWGVIPENFIAISKKYKIDIKIFTFEMGMEFTQEIEIIEGKLTKDEAKKYDDYFWDVPFSQLGG